MSNPIFTPEEIIDIARLKRDNNWSNEELAAYLQGKPMNNQDKPAFPQYTVDMHGTAHFEGGMSLREYAAIKLRVPDSGTDWLDAMIEKSLLNEFAGKALNGMLAHSTRYKPAYGYPHNWHAAISQEAFEIAEQMIYHSKGELYE